MPSKHASSWGLVPVPFGTEQHSNSFGSGEFWTSAMLGMVGCRWTASHEDAEVVPLDFLNNARQLHLEGRTHLGAQLDRSFGIEVEVLDT